MRPSSPECRRRTLLVAGPLLVSAALARIARAQDAAEGIRVMAREKSIAEQFVVVLNDFGRSDVATYAHAVILYADAKSEFDGLISELEYELAAARAPDQSPAFQAALQSAADKRVAFTSFVTGTVLPRSTDANKSILSDVIAGSGDLIKALTEAGVSIWHEFKASGDTRRGDIRQQLELLRWPPFSIGVAKAG